MSDQTPVVGSIVFNTPTFQRPEDTAAFNSLRSTLDAKAARVKELEGALRELMRVDEIGRDPNTHAESWRPLKRAAWERALKALKEAP